MATAGGGGAPMAVAGVAEAPLTVGLPLSRSRPAYDDGDGNGEDKRTKATIGAQNDNSDVILVLSEADIRKAAEIVRRLSDETKAGWPSAPSALRIGAD